MTLLGLSVSASNTLSQILIPISCLSCWMYDLIVSSHAHRRQIMFSVHNGEPSPYRTTTVSSVSLLRRRRRDGTASSSLLPVARVSTYFYQPHLLNWSSTHVVLSGVDRGRDTPPDREWERAREPWTTDTAVVVLCNGVNYTNTIYTE